MVRVTRACSMADSPVSHFSISPTKQATPYVAGVAALLWSYQPSAHVDDIQRALLSSAVDLGTPGRDDMSGEGLVNAVNALAVLKGDGPVASAADTEAASVGEYSSEELSLEIRIRMDPS